MSKFNFNLKFPEPNSNYYRFLVGICSVVVAFFGVYLVVWAGNLNPSAGPADTMQTLDDIYYRLQSSGAAGSFGIDSPGSPAATMHTLQQIYDATPNFNGDPGTASAADVCNSATFYSNSSTKIVGTRTSCSSGSGGLAYPIKTQQTTSYRSGDDGDIEAGTAIGSPRFTDNGDGTITDNQYNLMWPKDTSKIIASGAGGAGSNLGYWRDTLGSVTPGQYVSINFPAYAHNTAYVTGNIVTQGGTYYRALQNYTSTAYRPSSDTSYATKWRAINSWQNGVSYVAGQYVWYNMGWPPTLYKCKADNTSSVHGPPNDSDWATYWYGPSTSPYINDGTSFTVGQLIIGDDGKLYQCTSAHHNTDKNVLTNSPEAGTYWEWAYTETWVTSHAYSTGDNVVGSDGKAYRALSNHTSGSDDDEPTNGANWATYWVENTWVEGTAYTTASYVSNGSTAAHCILAHTASAYFPITSTGYSGKWTLVSANPSAEPYWGYYQNYTADTSVVNDGYYGYYYLAKQTHYSSAHEPENASDWTTYWETSSAIESYYDGYGYGGSYAIDDLVLGSDSKIYKCIQTCTPMDEGIYGPITGSDWASYWVLDSDPHWIEGTSYTTSPESFVLGTDGSTWYQCISANTPYYYTPGNAESSSYWETSSLTGSNPGVYACTVAHTAAEDKFPATSPTYWAPYDITYKSTQNATNISFVNSTSKIHRTTDSFVTDGYVAGQNIMVVGSTSNNGLYTISNVAAADLTVSGTLTDESAGAKITIATNYWYTEYIKTSGNGSTWNQAVDACSLLSWNGYSDWRLPNMNELTSLFDTLNYSNSNPTYGATGLTALKAAMKVDYDYYNSVWSSTTQYNDTNNAWTFRFYDSIISQNTKTSVTDPNTGGGPMKVIPVRTVQ